MPKYRNPKGPYWLALDEAERQIIREAMREFGGRVDQAAAALGIERSYLSLRMKALGMTYKDFRPPPKTSTELQREYRKRRREREEAAQKSKPPPLPGW